jgi:glycosyltransferase involved in cell wall biosynthesis
MKQYKIVLVTALYSPFQIDLAKEMNRLDLDCHVIFTMNLDNQIGENSRGAHWQTTDDYSTKVSHIYDWKNVAGLASDLENELLRLKPDILLATGILSSPIFAALKKLKRKGVIQCPLGFWLESANITTGRLKSILIEEVARHQLREMDFAFAIGSNALSYYSSLAPGLPMFDVPYGQDLAGFYNISRDTDTKCVRFLLSGQLLRRNNIQNIIKALYTLKIKRPRRWQLVVSGSGPEEALLARAAKGMGDKDWQPIVFYRQFESWSDRESSYKSCDVLLCPSLHTGWGLVVPEAVAAGMPVIATEFVNSARRFVVPGFNGLVIRPNPQSISDAMQFFIDNCNKISEMGDRGRVLSETGEASFVARLFEQNVKSILTAFSSTSTER